MIQKKLPRKATLFSYVRTLSHKETVGTGLDVVSKIEIKLRVVGSVYSIKKIAMRQKRNVCIRRYLVRLMQIL